MKIVLHIAAALVALVLCFFITRHSTNSWDTREHYMQSRWLLDSFGLLPDGAPVEIPVPVVQKYGPLWELTLSIFTEHIFSALNDPSWVRNAVTLWTFPAALYLIFILLHTSGVATSSALLVLAFLFGMIRLGGHALTNPKDYPLAIVYLLIAIYQWAWIIQEKNKSEKKRFSILSLTLLGIFSITPYLVRPPMLVHFGLALVIPPFLARTLKQKLSARIFIVPLLTGLISFAILYVPLRMQGIEVLFSSVSTFTKFAIGEHFGTRFFGETYIASHLPWWYLFIWPWIAFHPLVFLAMIAGLFFAITRIRRFSLSNWLLMYGIIAILGIFVTRPFLYNEDRHLLFIYPPFLAAAALALSERMRPRWNEILSLVIFVSAILTYGFWGRYSYVYKNPLIGDRRAASFSGDYWGLCVSEAARALPAHVPAGEFVLLNVPLGIVTLETERMGHSLLFRNPEYRGYRWIFKSEEASAAGKYYLLTFNELGRDETSLKDVRDGKAQLLWQNKMPPDDPACSLIFYKGHF